MLEEFPKYNGFPLVKSEVDSVEDDDWVLLGYVHASELKLKIRECSKYLHPDTPMYFQAYQAINSTRNGVNCSDLVDDTVIRIVPDTPLYLIHQIFHKLGLRLIAVVSRGRFKGLITKKAFVKYVQNAHHKQEHKPKNKEPTAVEVEAAFANRAQNTTAALLSAGGAMPSRNWSKEGKPGGPDSRISEGPDALQGGPGNLSESLLNLDVKSSQSVGVNGPNGPGTAGTGSIGAGLYEAPEEVGKTVDKALSHRDQLHATHGLRAHKQQLQDQANTTDSEPGSVPHGNRTPGSPWQPIPNMNSSTIQTNEIFQSAKSQSPLVKQLSSTPTRTFGEKSEPNSTQASMGKRRSLPASAFWGAGNPANLDVNVDIDIAKRPSDMRLEGRAKRNLRQKNITASTTTGEMGLADFRRRSQPGSKDMTALSPTISQQGGATNVVVDMGKK